MKNWVLDLSSYSSFDPCLPPTMLENYWGIAPFSELTKAGGPMFSSFVLGPCSSGATIKLSDCFFLWIAPQDIFIKNRHCVMAQACKVHSMLGMPTTYSANEWSECSYGYQVGCSEIIQGPFTRPVCWSKCMLGTTRIKQRQPQWLSSGTSRRYWSAKICNSSRQELASIGSLEPCQITYYYFDFFWPLAKSWVVFALLPCTFPAAASLEIRSKHIRPCLKIHGAWAMGCLGASWRCWFLLNG